MNFKFKSGRLRLNIFSFSLLTVFSYVYANTPCTSDIPGFQTLKHLVYPFKIDNQPQCFFGYITDEVDPIQNLNGSGNHSKAIWFGYYSPNDLKVHKLPLPPDNDWTNICDIDTVSFESVYSNQKPSITVIGACSRQNMINYTYPLVFKWVKNEYQLDTTAYKDLFGFVDMQVSNIKKYLASPKTYYKELEQRDALIKMGKELVPNSPLDKATIDKLKSSQLVSLAQLHLMFPYAKVDKLKDYVLPLNKQLEQAKINTPKRLAYFFATVNEETAGLTDGLQEDFIYRHPAYARSLFRALKKMTNAQIKALGYGANFANVIYANLNGNGDIQSGDGYHYRGRGLFNYTGKNNYLNVGGDKFVQHPDLAYIAEYDVSAAIAYWQLMHINELADKIGLSVPIPKSGKVTDPAFRNAVRVVNRGLAGINNRARFYNRYIVLFNSAPNRI